MANWWTSQNDARPEEGHEITFRFGEEMFNKMKIKELDEPGQVRWECVDGADEWIGTQLTFSLESNKGKKPFFAHDRWEEHTDFFCCL